MDIKSLKSVEGADERAPIQNAKEIEIDPNDPQVRRPVYTEYTDIDWLTG